MKLDTKHTSFSFLASLVSLLLFVTTFACNPAPQGLASTPAAVEDLPTELLSDQIATLVATFTPEPTATPAGEQYAWNNIGEMESGGVSIQIARLVIADKLALPQDLPVDPVFQEMPVVAEIIFIIKNKNTGDDLLLVFPRHATIETGSETIFVEKFPFHVGETVNGGVRGGETKVGGYWFGIEQTSIDEIQDLLISFAAPVKYGDPLLEPQGSDFVFELDLSQRRNDPVPDELKDLKISQ